MSSKRVVVLVVAVLLLGLGIGVGRLSAGTLGDLNPLSPPDSTSSYSLDDIYQRLFSGAAGSASTFQEPGSGPGSTMHTLDDIMASAPKVDSNGADPADVTAGKVFWGLSNVGWGKYTGTLQTSGGCDCTCSGCTLTGTRWCDNDDGTVTDLTNCLVWLQKADWAGQKKWFESTAGDDASGRVSDLADSAAGADLSDGSESLTWRLPTYQELKGITSGDDLVSNASQQAFTGVQNAEYWSSSTNGLGAYSVHMATGAGNILVKTTNTRWVWPVRGP